MKILLIHHSRALGGGTLSLLDIGYMIKGLGHDVEIMLSPGNTLAKNLIKEKGFKLLNNDNEFLTFHHYQGGPSIFRLILRAFKYSKPNKRLKKYWKEAFSIIDHDIVILNSVVLWPMLKCLNSKTTIQFIRETIKGKPNNLINRLIRKKLSRSDFTTFLSQHDMVSWNVSSKNKIVLPDILNDEMFKKQFKSIDELKVEYQIKKSNYVFLYTGGFNKLKGIHVLLDAFKKIDNDKISLLIIGDKGENILKKKGVSKYINFRKINFLKKQYKKIHKNGVNINVIGNVKDPSVFYSICDCVIFPAIKAHQARPLYEAGFFSKPAILPNYDNYKEYLIDNYNGYYFNPRDPKDLSKKMLNCFDNFSHCYNLGKNNLHMTEKYHSYSYGKSIMKSIFNILEKKTERK